MKSIFMLFLFSVFMSLPTWAGNDVENGGDSVAFEFTRIAGLTLESLQKQQQDQQLSPELSAWVEKLSQNFRTVKVSSQEYTELQGLLVDALNYPLENRIVVCRRCWKDSVSSTETRIGLVLHEYLSVSQIEDSDYSRSHKLAAALRPDYLGQMVAQESFLKVASDLEVQFEMFHQDPELISKKLCVLAGEIKFKVQSLNQAVTDHPGWFRSEAIHQPMEALIQIAHDFENECLSSDTNWRLLEEDSVRGHDQIYYLRALLFAF